MPKSTPLNLILFLLRVSLGAFFLYTAIMKFGDLSTTADVITRSRLLPEWASMPLASVGIGMEWLVAICLIFKLSYRGATLWCAVMCATFLFIYAQAWVRGLELSCNCLGTSAEVTDYPFDTGLRLLFFAVSILLIWDAFCITQPARKKNPLQIKEF